MPWLPLKFGQRSHCTAPARVATEEEEQSPHAVELATGANLPTSQGLHSVKDCKHKKKKPRFRTWRTLFPPPYLEFPVFPCRARLTDGAARSLAGGTLGCKRHTEKSRKVKGEEQAEVAVTR